jgi:hypothetical protein
VDPNAEAQEKALEALKAFVDRAAPACSEVASDIIPGLMDKCLLKANNKNKELAQAIILLFIEIGMHERVLKELHDGLKDTRPTVVVPCLNLLRLALASFGPQIVKTTPLTSNVIKGLADPHSTVRDASMQLGKEMSRWKKNLHRR